jgi:hypothetical protein
MIVLLIFFAVGAVVGVLAMSGNVLQQRREIARLRKDMESKKKPGDVTEKMPSPQLSG